PRDLHLQVQGLSFLLGDEFFLKADEGVIRKLALGSLDGIEDTGLGDDVGREIDVVLILEFFDDVLKEQLVEVVAAQLGVAVARQDFNNAFLGLNDRDVEGAAAEIIDKDAVQAGILRIVGKRGRGRLIENA